MSIRSFLRDLPELTFFALRHPHRYDVLDEFVRIEMARPVWLRVRSESTAKRDPEFRFDGRTYPYLYHPYHATWSNERTAEVPLASREVDTHAGQRILEVGNVLGHYRHLPAGYTVVDKYEHAPGVVNRDIVAYDDRSAFDFVLSVSTLEHIGWDERPRDPGKGRRAIENLDRLLAPGGSAWFTVPIGQNPNMDRIVRDGPPFGARVRFLRRVSWDNRWTECTRDDALQRPYGNWEEWQHRSDAPYPFANAIAVVDWSKPPGEHGSRTVGGAGS